MNIKDQIITRLYKMENKLKQLNLSVEKYRQETQYVCLKTGVIDWMTFLTEIRMGRIAYHSKQIIDTNSKVGNQKNNSAIGLLNDLFQGKSTNRSTGRQHICECESPICSEGSIKRIKGGDTSRSESNSSQYINIKDELNSDPFNKYKIEYIMQPKQQLQQQSIEQILKYIQKYQAQKFLPLGGFQTFRKIQQKQQILNQTRQYNESTQKKLDQVTLTSDRIQKLNCLNQTVKTQNKFKPFWKNKQNIPLEYRQWKPQLNFEKQNQYTLAIQNTKLRKQLKELQQKIVKQKI